MLAESYHDSQKIHLGHLYLVIVYERVLLTRNSLLLFPFFPFPPLPPFPYYTVNYSNG